MQAWKYALAGSLLNLPVWAADIGALCYLTPAAGILHLSGTPGTRIATIHVKPGQSVAEGDPLMTFSNLPALENELKSARQTLKNHQLSTPAALELQALAIEGAKHSVKQSRNVLDSYKSLPSSAQAKIELNRRMHALKSAKHKVIVEQSRLNQMRIDADVQTSILQNKIQLAEAQLTQARLLSPSDATVLEIMRQRGESAGGKVDISLADLSVMSAVCEVFEGDVLKLKPGMPAEISSDSLPQSQSASISRISNEINPTSKVAKVWVTLDNAVPANRLVGMEVNVNIKQP